MNKKLYPIIGIICVVSIVLNGVLYQNLRFQEDRISANYFSKLEEKDETITHLHEKISNLENDMGNAPNSELEENREEISSTVLDKQNEHQRVAESFLNMYLNFDNQNLNERRENLFSFGTAELVNRLAPEVKEGIEEELNAGLTFLSEIEEMKIYITGVNIKTNSSEILADVTYVITSYEGSSTVRSFVQMTLREIDGAIKVTDYMNHSIL